MEDKLVKLRVKLIETEALRIKAANDAICVP